MYTIHRSIDVGFAHHVRGHRGPCINLHGHTWKFEVGLQAGELDAEGFVIDFARMRREVLEPVHRLLDHGLAIGEDTYVEVAAEVEPLGVKLISSRARVHGSVDVTPAPRSAVLAGAENRFPGGLKLAVFPFNPTSERLAAWLFRVAKERLADDRVSVAWTRVYESLHPVESVAEYRPTT